MRPKKLILVLDPDDASLGPMMFSLTIRGYRVVGAHTIEEANTIIKAMAIDCVLWTECGTIRDYHAPVPCVRRPPKLPAGDMDRILEEITVRSAKKRGPKKGFVPWNRRPVQSEEIICKSANVGRQ